MSLPWLLLRQEENVELLQLSVSMAETARATQPERHSYSAATGWSVSIIAIALTALNIANPAATDTTTR